MKKNISVETMRIIACLIVIGTHVRLTSVDFQGNIDFSRSLINCFLSDGVAVFWFITGFFLFKNENYKNVLLKTFHTIFMPMFILTLFCWYLGDFLVNNTSIQASVFHTFTEYVEVIKGFLSGVNIVDFCGHTWYVFTYFFVVLIFPILKSFVTYLDNDISRQKNFLMIIGCLLLVNDLTNNSLCNFSLYSLNSVIPASIFIIIGHILYIHKDNFIEKIPTYLLIFSFMMINFVRNMIQIQNYSLDHSNFHTIYWYSSFGLLSALIIIWILFKNEKRIEKVCNNKIILNLSSQTFLVYLIHPIIKEMLYNLGKVNSNLSYFLSQFTHGVVFETLYTLSMILILFVISMLTSYLLKRFKILVDCLTVNLWNKV